MPAYECVTKSIMTVFAIKLNLIIILALPKHKAK